MDGAAEFDHAVDDFGEDAFDDHDFTGGVVAGHEGGHEAAGGHAAQAVALFHYEGFGSVACGSDGGAHSCGASADHDDVGASQIFVFIFRGAAAHCGRGTGQQPARKGGTGGL